MTTRIIAVESATNALNSKVGNLEVSTNALQVQATALQSATGTLNAATNALQIQITTLKSSTSTLNSYIGNLQTATGVLNTAVGKLNTSTNYLNIHVGALESATNSMTIRIAAGEGATNALNTRLTAAESSTNYLSGQVTALKSATNNLQSQATALIAATNALQIQSTALQGATSSLNTSVATLKTSTNNLSGRVSVLENAGYLTASTNLFKEITVADRSSLGTNLSGLTQGTYTGLITSVSYTGVTVLTSGQTYEFGFTKQNSYGTSTLSIASFSLVKTTSGATSNYFTFFGTDTNLVLKLDGDGSAKSDVSSVYVRQITNGSINVAGDINCGGTFRVNGLSIYDLPGINTNLSALNNDAGFVTGDTNLWNQAAVDASTATNETAVLAGATNSLQSQINNIGALSMERYFADVESNVFVCCSGTGVVCELSGSTYTFTVPANVKINSAVINHNGVSLGQQFKIVIAEDVMNTSAKTRVPAMFQAYRSDNGNPIAGASCRPDDLVNFNTENVYGLQAINYNICKFSW
jgi:prefoldin subunit 5